MLSATEECVLRAFPRCSTWGWGDDPCLCHPAPADGLNQLKRTNFINIFLFKSLGDCKSQVSNSQLKDNMFFASWRKRDCEEDDGQGLSKKKYLQLLLKFSIIKCKEKKYLLSCSLQVL